MCLNVVIAHALISVGSQARVQTDGLHNEQNCTESGHAWHNYTCQELQVSPMPPHYLHLSRAKIRIVWIH